MLALAALPYLESTTMSPPREPDPSGSWGAGPVHRKGRIHGLLQAPDGLPDAALRTARGAAGGVLHRAGHRGLGAHRVVPRGGSDVLRRASRAALRGAAAAGERARRQTREGTRARADATP